MSRCCFWLLRVADFHYRRSCRLDPPRNEKVVVIQVAVHMTRNLGCLGAKSCTPTLQEHYNDYPTKTGVGIGGEPAKARSSTGTRSGLAENFFFAKVEAQAARGPVLHRAHHAV